MDERDSGPRGRGARDVLERGDALEAAFVERTDEGAFLVYFMKADDVDAVHEAFEDSDHDIDLAHAEVLEDVLESPKGVGDYELLDWLSDPDRP